MTEPMQIWAITWSSATGCGNANYRFPQSWTRQRIIREWEANHKGCNVDILRSVKGEE